MLNFSFGWFCWHHWLHNGSLCYPRHMRDEKFITITVGSWEKTVYKPFFYKKINEIKQAKNLDETFDELEKKRAYSFILFMLGRRSYTKAELTQKLRERKISQQSIDAALARADPYLNDEAVVLAYLKRELRKGYGPNIAIPKVAQRLRTSIDTVAPLFDEIELEEIEEAKEKLLQKKKGKDPREILYKRGFRSDL